MIEAGQKVKFKPFEDMGMRFPRMFDEDTSGIVVYVHKKHGWFMVEYGNCHNRISFKFSDIGNNVHIVNDEE